jgi:[ribosomal protein S18]-alanine N-acetyltransferase
MLIIRQATVDDLSWLSAFEESNFSQPYQAKDLLYEMTENPFSTTWIISSDGCDCGYGILWVMYDQAQLVKIAVSQSFRRLGVGKYLLNYMIDFAVGNGCELMTLEVRESNTGAIAFYQQYGFVQVAIRKDYYQHPCEDALMMMKGLI